MPCLTTAGIAPHILRDDTSTQSHPHPLQEAPQYLQHPAPVQVHPLTDFHHQSSPLPEMLIQHYPVLD